MLDKSHAPARRTQIPKWLAVMAAIVSPFVGIALLEGAFRLFGPDVQPTWENPYVAFEGDTVFFRRWDTELTQPRPPKTYRVFTLGGSTTAGFGVEKSFTDHLAERLAPPDGFDRIEIRHGGVQGAGTHRVFEVMKRAVQFDPQLLIVFTGHNEFLEEIMFAEDSITTRAAGISELVRKLRVVVWLRGLLPEVEVPRVKLGSKFLAPPWYPLIESPEAYQRRLRFTESNLELMINLAHERGIALLVVPAVPNLLEPPRGSSRGENFFAHQEAWEQAHQAALAAWETGRWQESKPHLQKALALEPNHSETLFYLGQAQVLEGDAENGLATLRAANQNSTVRDRLSDDIGELIVRTAAAHGVPVLDVSERIFAQLPAEVGRLNRGEPLELFSDHCHLTDLGHRWVAEAIEERLVELGWAGRSLPPSEDR